MRSSIFGFRMEDLLVVACELSCGSMWDLVPWPGVKPKSPALEVQGLIHYTTRGVPSNSVISAFLSVISFLLFPLHFCCFLSYFSIWMSSLVIFILAYLIKIYLRLWISLGCDCNQGLLRWHLWWRTCLPMLEMEETWVWSLCWEEHGNSVQIFLPGESHGQRSLVGYSPCGHKMCLVCTLVWDSWPLYSFQFLLFGMGMSVLSLPHHCILETVSSFICCMWKVILSEVQPYPVYYPYLIRWFRRIKTYWVDGHKRQWKNAICSNTDGPRDYH